MMTNNIAVNSAHMISPAAQPAAAHVNDSAEKNGLNDAGHLQETHERVLDNVVAVSKDGDTLQVFNDDVANFGTVTERNTLTEGKNTDASAAIEENGRKKIFEQEKTFNREEIFDKGNPVNQDSITDIEDSFEREKLFGTENTFDSKQLAGRDETIDRQKMLGKENSFDRESMLGKDNLFGSTGDDPSDTAQAAQRGDIASYAGYTDSQMEQLYLRGDISKIEYDQEMEQREQEREAVNGRNKDFSGRMAYNINEINEMLRNSQSIDVALSNQSADEPLRADERMKLMETLDQNQVKMGSTVSESEKNNQAAAQNAQNTPVSVQINNQTVKMANEQAQDPQNPLISEDGTVRLRIL